MFSQIDAVLTQGEQDIELALVRGLVELHGGTVEVRNRGIGQGSEFFMSLPLLDSE